MILHDTVQYLLLYSLIGKKRKNVAGSDDDREFTEVDFEEFLPSKKDKNDKNGVKGTGKRGKRSASLLRNSQFSEDFIIA